VSELFVDLTREIIGAAIAVHRELGPGLLESAYESCLAFEIADRGLKFERQKALPLIYRSQAMGCGYRLDLLVEASVIVEVKSVERLDAIHTAQLLAYLRLSGCKVGLLMNFNVRWLVDEGIKRIVRGFQ
jgi:GxxExxY protein